MRVKRVTTLRLRETAPKTEVIGRDSLTPIFPRLFCFLSLALGESLRGGGSACVRLGGRGEGSQGGREDWVRGNGNSAEGLLSIIFFSYCLAPCFVCSASSLFKLPSCSLYCIPFFICLKDSFVLLFLYFFLLFFRISPWLLPLFQSA